MRVKVAWPVLILLVATAACSAAEEEKAVTLVLEKPEVVHTVSAVLEGAVPTSSPTLLPPASLTPIPTQFPSPTASAIPVVLVYGPPIWTDAIKESFESLKAGGSNYTWQNAQEAGQADLIISTDSASYLAGYRPFAFVVPFTSDLTQISIDDANEILLNGHPLIDVLDLSELAPNYRFVEVDDYGPFDPVYPILQEWSVVHTEGFEEAAEELSSLLVEQHPTDHVIHLAAVGDIMLDRSLGTAIRQGNTDYPFGFVKEQLSAADLTIGNLESSLGDLGEAVNKSYAFQAPPEASKSLASAGFDLLSLANNHAMDYGQDALVQGIRLLQKEGIDVVGAGADSSKARAAVYLESKGAKIAFLAYVDVPVEGSGFDTRSWIAGQSSPGLNWANPDNIASDVSAAADNSDVVIVLLHSGYEYRLQPSPEQTTAARAAIDAGADLVIGHHAHVLQGLEFYNEGVIAYGLGNFAFDIDGDPSTGILSVWLDKGGIRQLDLVPALIQRGGQPRLATTSEALLINQQVNEQTVLLNGE